MDVIPVWCIGLESNVYLTIDPLISRCKVVKLDYDLEKLMADTNENPAIILCGPTPEGVSLKEVAQMLSMQHTNIPIYYVAYNKQGYDRPTLMKNGFSDTFLLPLDNDFLKQKLNEYLTALTKGEIKSYRPVKLIDIDSDTVLDFDTTIYLPHNKRYIKYSNAGDPMDPSRIAKLSQHKMNSVFVTSDQIKKFYAYTAEKLKQIGKSGSLSATEKRDKLETSIRQLMSGIFNDNVKDSSFAQAENLMKDCREIVKSYIVDSPNNDWYTKLMSMMGEMGSNYGHSANVSTFASLFSIGLGIGDPMEMATAGLLHDIGLTEVPPEILAKAEADWTPEERAIYQKHPEFSIDILKRRKIALSDKMAKAILQHHEQFNGGGYPKGLAGDRICKEAQILSLADQFDELTSLSEGKKRLTPRQAVMHFKELAAADPGRAVFDPQLLNSILKLFPVEDEKIESAA